MSQLNDDILRFRTDMSKTHDFVHGDALSAIETESGLVPTLAKLVADKKVDIDIATANFLDQKELDVNAAADGILQQTKEVKTQTEAVRDSINNRLYPGFYTTAPTTRPDGSAIQNSDEYLDATYRYVRRAGVWVNYEKNSADSAAAAAASKQAADTDAQQALTANASATAANTAAQAAKIAAEAARDAANNTGKVFANTTLGLAGTTSGQSFSVLDATALFWNVYLNSSGTAVWQAASYTKTYIDQNIPGFFESIDPTFNDPKSAFLLDSARRVIAQMPDPRVSSLASNAMSMVFFETTDVGNLPGTLVVDSKFRVILTMSDLSKSVTALNASALTSSFYETLDATSSMMLVDAQKRVLATVPSSVAINTLQSTLTTAAGSTLDLPTRLSHGLTAYGDPIGPYAGRWSLRESRMRLSKRASGEASQLVMAFIGDSYTQAPTRYVGPLAKRLQDVFGLAGVGWLGFAWFAAPLTGTWAPGSQPGGKDFGARSELISVLEVVGTWTCAYNDATTNTPSLSVIKSSGVDNYVRFTVPSDHHACRLFYGGDGTGVVQVSWDDGVTYGANVALNTVGAGNVLLSGIPSNACVARIKVVSGNVWLAGVDLQSNTSGIRIHKLGGSGSSAATWVGVNGATWGAQIQALGAHTHQVMLGTNDQGGNVVPGTFASRLATMFANIQAVLPYSDKVIAMPAENQRTNNTYPMTAYAQAAREYALANDIAYCDMQYFFGSPANYAFEYAYANPARQWYAADLIHPDPNTGGRVMVEALYRLLTAQ